MDIFTKVYENEGWKAKFESKYLDYFVYSPGFTNRGITMELRLIDDMVAQVLFSKAMKNEVNILRR